MTEACYDDKVNSSNDIGAMFEAMEIIFFHSIPITVFFFVHFGPTKPQYQMILASFRPTHGGKRRSGLGGPINMMPLKYWSSLNKLT